MPENQACFFESSNYKEGKMIGQWLLLINRQEKTYYRMHERLNEKYSSKLRRNPNRIAYRDFEDENELDNAINELETHGYISNPSLENLAFDWKEE